jgi:UDP-glucose 4-epimerase
LTLLVLPNLVTEALAGSRCLVTGGAGFIGSNLVSALVDIRCRVTVIDDFSTGRRQHLPSSEAVQIIDSDVTRANELSDVLGDTDFVFHMAAQVGNVKSIADPIGDARTNVVGTVALLDAARTSHIKKLVLSSSSAVFGEAQQVPIAEHHPHRPASFYALSKSSAEQYVLLAVNLLNIPAVCLRYFNVYGTPIEASEYSGVINIFFDNLARGGSLTVYGDGLQERDFVYVRDVVRANLLAAALGRPGDVFNIGTGRATTISELARIMSDVAGRNLSISFAPPRPGEVQRSVAAIEAARRILGYEPTVDLRTGLQQVWDVVSKVSASDRARTKCE